MHRYGSPDRRFGTPNDPVAPDVERPVRSSWFRPLPDEEPDDNSGDSPELVDEVLAITAAAILRKSKAQVTREAYRRDFEHFRAWAKRNGREALPASPETIKLYLAAYGIPGPGKEYLAIATLERRLVGIAHAHAAQKLPSPTRADIVRQMLAGIRREGKEQGFGKPKKARPLLVADIRKIIESIDTTRLIGKRDKALLLMEWCGAFRSGEIRNVHVSDLSEHDEGIAIELRFSKTDQFGNGEQIGLLYGENPATCPVIALKEWLAASKIESGPVIRYVNRHGNVSGEKGISRQEISKVFRKLARNAGIDDTDITGHSARAGIATQMILAGMTEAEAMAHGRWKNPKVFRGYVRVKKAFKNSPVRLVGL